MFCLFRCLFSVRCKKRFVSEKLNENEQQRGVSCTSEWKRKKPKEWLPGRVSDLTPTQTPLSFCVNKWLFVWFHLNTTLWTTPADLHKESTTETKKLCLKLSLIKLNFKCSVYFSAKTSSRTIIFPITCCSKCTPKLLVFCFSLLNWMTEWLRHSFACAVVVASFA